MTMLGWNLTNNSCCWAKSVLTGMPCAGPLPYNMATGPPQLGDLSMISRMVARMAVILPE